MTPSNLQLKSYFLTELNVSANRSFENDGDVILNISDVVSEPSILPTDEENTWQITLQLRLLEASAVNAPYFFRIELVGIFKVSENISEEKRTFFAEVNGSSILYSTAREILRSTTANGPYPAITLPTLSFFDPERVRK